MSATDSDSTSGSVATMNGPVKKCLLSATVEVRILLPEAWIGLIGRTSMPCRPMRI